MVLAAGYQETEGKFTVKGNYIQNCTVKLSEDMESIQQGSPL
jgi:hypothetical protein